MQPEASSPAPPYDNVDALRLVVQERDAEIQLVKLLVQKLKLQVAWRNRMLFGSASERFVDGHHSPHGILLEGAVTGWKCAADCSGEAGRCPVLTAANNSPADRSLPAHLPR